ncbi:MAG: hypothetical protein JOZ43_09115, partial [Acidobacteriales bacterium]|nr:hypothetical protein [Terriglobales bacterium]
MRFSDSLELVRSALLPGGIAAVMTVTGLVGCGGGSISPQQNAGATAISALRSKLLAARFGGMSQLAAGTTDVNDTS